MITVFTSTYNRGYLLKRLYDSLREQTNKDFEWLIVDDGSTDNTNGIVEQFILQEKEFIIRYLKKENGGKHRAINYGITQAKGELFFIVDSDDWLPKDSIKTIYFYYNSIADNEMFAGVAGAKFFEDNKMVGSSFSDETYIDCSSLNKEKNNLIGDKAEVFKTSILKQYPFPEFENENFLSEAIVWNKIASDGYVIRWFNDNIYYCEYQTNGLTHNLRNNYRRNPKGYLTYVEQEVRLRKVSWIKKMILIGKCVYTINNVIDKKTIMQIFHINFLEFVFSKYLFYIYFFLGNLLGKNILD